MESEEEQSEWIFVAPSRSKRHKDVPLSKILSKGTTPLTSQSQAAELFLSSYAFSSNSQIIGSLLPKEPMQVHCLGLGKFCSQLKPYLQYLFFLEGIIPAIEKQLEVNIYDPVFGQAQLNTIKEKGWSCRPVEAEETSSKICLWYMPHCERDLYELVLEMGQRQGQRQWVLIGNSIHEYQERSRMLGEAIPTAFQGASPPAKKLLDYRNAFNDTFVSLI